jgi:hypothetical protein
MAYVGAADLSVGRVLVDCQSQEEQNKLAALRAPFPGGDDSIDEGPKGRTEALLGYVDIRWFHRYGTHPRIGDLE